MTALPLIILAAVQQPSLTFLALLAHAETTDHLVEVSRYGGIPAYLFYIGGGLLMLLTVWIWRRRGK